MNTKTLFGILTIMATLLAQVRAQVPFTNSLVAYYPFNGNANDASGNGNNGTLFGAAAFGVDRFGNTNACLSLPGGEGGGSGVDVPSLLNAPLSQLTYSAWFRLSNYPPGAFMPLMGRIVCGSTQCGAICITAQEFAYFTGGGGYYMQQAAPLNSWCQVVFTLDNSGSANFYLNGTNAPSSGSAPASQPIDFCIGAATANGCGSGGDFYVWNGLIEDVRVYNRNLSASEVSQLYQYESGLPPMITNQPQSVVVPANSTTSFSVTASGTAPLSYQWQFNGTNLSDGGNITGSSSSALTLQDVATNQAGSYTVVITNIAGAVTSSPAILNVLFIFFSVNGQPIIGMTNAVGSALVTISGGYADGFLFYTIDGSTPTLDSPLYTGPFTLTNSAVLQAMSLNDDFSESAQASPVTVQIIPGYNLQTSVIGSGTISLNPASGPYASNSVVTLTALAAGNWAFDHWTGGATGSQNPTSVTMNGPVSVQAVFIPTAYPLTIGTAGGGSVTANGQPISSNTYYPAGSRVTLAATASNGWSFMGWQGTAVGTNNPLNVTMNQTNNIQAIFGTVVSTNPVGGGSIVLNLTNPVPYGTMLTVSAVPNAGKYLVLWSSSVSGTNSPALFLVTNANPSVNALFNTLPGGKYSLAVVVTGNGSVAINPQKSYYNPGDSVTLTASTTNTGTSFFGWTGSLFATNSPLMVVVNSNMVVQANFGAPTIVNITPQNVIVYGGSNAVLTANAAGVPPLTYQWQNSQGTIAGQTNAIFAIVNAQSTNSDNYSVIVSNPFGSVTSAVATVKVVFPPSISVQPVPQAVVAGSSLTLSVSADGTAPLAYQWAATEGLIDGATNSSLTMNPALTNYTDTYWVVISNSYGVVTSQVAAILVYSPINIQTQPGSLIVPPYASATLQVTAAAFPAGPLSYQWSFNSVNIAGATSSTLSISNVVQTNLGTYTVLITNAFTSTTSANAVLAMYPFLVAPFTGAVTYWGQSTTLGVQAWGTGPLSYQWYQNGVAVPDATNPTLPFSAIQFTNAGLYTVVVSDSLGSVTNTPYQVVVNPADVALQLCPNVVIQGTVGYNYIIQSTTNLADTNSWATQTNLTLTQPVEYWDDTNTDVTQPSNPQKFYRVLPEQ